LDFVHHAVFKNTKILCLLFVLLKHSMMDEVQKVNGAECEAECRLLSLMLKIEVIAMNKYTNK
jgi:hypothetical protein